MTIAQYKIITYPETMMSVSKKHNISRDLLSYARNGKIPLEPKMKQLEKIYGIKNDIRDRKTKISIIEKYNEYRMAHVAFSYYTNVKCCNRTFDSWISGTKRPTSQETYKLIYEFFDICNEWVDEYKGNINPDYTIAQNKILNYKMLNNISWHDLADKISKEHNVTVFNNYLINIIKRNSLPCKYYNAFQEFFDIKSEIGLDYSAYILDKYGTYKKACAVFNDRYSINCDAVTFGRMCKNTWAFGFYRNKFCDFLGIKDEWTQYYV